GGAVAGRGGGSHLPLSPPPPPPPGGGGGGGGGAATGETVANPAPFRPRFARSTFLASGGGKETTGRHAFGRFRDSASSTAMRTATPISTCWRMSDWEPSATPVSISTPRFIGPGCITSASGFA